VGGRERGRTGEREGAREREREGVLKTTIFIVCVLLSGNSRWHERERESECEGATASEQKRASNTQRKR